MFLFMLDGERIVNLDLIVDAHWLEDRDYEGNDRRRLVLLFAAPEPKGVGAHDWSVTAYSVNVPDGPRAVEIWGYLSTLASDQCRKTVPGPAIGLDEPFREQT